MTYAARFGEIRRNHPSSKTTRCNLCGLLLRENEESFAALYSRSGYWIRSIPFQVGPERSIKISYECSKQFSEPHPTYVFHAICYGVFQLLAGSRHSFMTFLKIAQSLNPSFEPAYGTYRSRYRDRLQMGLADLRALQTKDPLPMLLGRLPSEILSEVCCHLDDCTYTSTVIAFHVIKGFQEALDRHGAGSQNCKVRLGFESYMLAVEDIPLPITSNCSLSIDDIGVQNIQIHCRKLPVLVEYSSKHWYKNISGETSDSLVNQTRSIELARKGLLSEGLCIGHHTGVPFWNTNLPPIIQDHNCYVHGKDEKRFSSLFSSKQYLIHRPLSRNLSGLTVSCGQGSSWTVHTHDCNDNFLIPYNDVEAEFGKNTIWIYFPMDQGERIDNIWIRRPTHRTKFFYSSCLVIHTTKDRLKVFGPHLDSRYSSYYDFVDLRGPNDWLPTGLSYDSQGVGSEDYGAKFAVDFQAHEGGFQAVTFPKPEHPMTSLTNLSANLWTWYLSFLPKGDVQSVKICTDNNLLNHPCLGLLVTMNDNAVYALGQWRFDRHISQLYLKPKFLMFKTSGLHGCVHDAHCIPDIHSCENEYQCIPLTESVVFWFSEIGSVIKVPSQGNTEKIYEMS